MTEQSFLAEMRRRFDEVIRAGEEFDVPGYRRERKGGVLRVLGPCASEHHNWIDYQSIPAGAEAAAVAAQQRFFATQRRAFRWKLYRHDHADSLAQALLNAGFEAQDPIAVLAFDSSRALPRSDAIELIKIEDPQQLAEALAPIQDEVWDETGAELLEALSHELAQAPMELSVHVARRDGQALGCGWIRFGPGTTFAGLYGGATRPAMRGLGVYRSLLSVRVEEARRRGFSCLIVEAGPMSRPILGHLGFNIMSWVTNYVSRLLRLPLRASRSQE